MVRVRARKTCYLSDQKLHKAGEVFDYSGPIGGPVVHADAPLDVDEQRALQTGLESPPPWTTPGFAKHHPANRRGGGGDAADLLT